MNFIMTNQDFGNLLKFWNLSLKAILTTAALGIMPGLIVLNQDEYSSFVSAFSIHPKGLVASNHGRLADREQPSAAE